MTKEDSEEFNRADYELSSMYEDEDNPIDNLRKNKHVTLKKPIHSWEKQGAKVGFIYILDIH